MLTPNDKDREAIEKSLKYLSSMKADGGMVIRTKTAEEEAKTSVEIFSGEKISTKDVKIIRIHGSYSPTLKETVIIGLLIISAEEYNKDLARRMR